MAILARHTPSPRLAEARGRTRLSAAATLRGAVAGSIVTSCSQSRKTS